MTSTVQDRRTPASLADINEVTDQIEVLRDEILGVVRAALPLTENLRGSVDDWTTEFQARVGDGRWANMTARQAMEHHKSGHPVRQRRVTGWTETTR